MRGVSWNAYYCVIVFGANTAAVKLRNDTREDFGEPVGIDGQEVRVDIDPAITIQKGRTIDVHLEGDIKPSAGNRTIKFNIFKPDHISVKGLTYGFYVSAWPEGNTAMTGNSVFLTSDGTTDGDELNPFFSGALITVVPASLQVGR